MIDIENAPCDRCESPVHLQHDPPCEHGYIACGGCGHAAVCDECKEATC